MRRLTFLLLFFLPIACVARSQTTPLVLDGLGRMTLRVDGVWQFQAGDNPAWASPSLDDSAWQPIQVGRSWEDQGHRDYTGFAWYRRHIVISPGTPADLDLALFLTGVQDAAEVYWNGKLVGVSASCRRSRPGTSRGPQGTILWARPGLAFLLCASGARL